MNEQQNNSTIMSVEAFGEPSGSISAFSGDITPGTTVTGTISEIGTQECHVFDPVEGKPTNEIDRWKDGKPKVQLKVIVQTDLPPESETDDGKRSIFIKGWGLQRKAYQDAVRRNGGKAPKHGDTFTAKYVGLGQAQGRLNPPKIYEYTITPSAQSSVEAFGAPSQLAQQRGSMTAPVNFGANAQAMQPVQAAPPQTAQPHVDPMTVTQLRNAGKQDMEIARLLGVQPADVMRVPGRAAAATAEPSEPEF